MRYPPRRGVTSLREWNTGTSEHDRNIIGTYRNIRPVLRHQTATPILLSTHGAMYPQARSGPVRHRVSAQCNVRNESGSHGTRGDPRKWTIRATGKSARASQAAFRGGSPTTTSHARPDHESGSEQKVSAKSRGHVPHQVSAKSPVNRGQVPRAFTKADSANDHHVKSRRYKIVRKKWIRDGRKGPLRQQ